MNNVYLYDFTGSFRMVFFNSLVLKIMVIKVVLGMSSIQIVDFSLFEDSL